MDAVIILQARTTSTRLPGKALLPIAGRPSAIVAALRAANRQHRTILATSDDRADDVLASEAHGYGIEVFRGPLNDVLARYYLASANLPDGCAIVRLTADNVVPDGRLVVDMVEAFVSGGLEYLDVCPWLSRVPCGLSAEVFSRTVLRKAHALALVAEDREHVGLWMKRNCKSAVFIPHLAKGEDYSRLRCTIDEPEDYQTILRLFDGVRNPWDIGWLELVRKLARLPAPAQSRTSVPSSDALPTGLVLGTAQLGMEYGRVNDSGKPSRQQAVAIVRRAVACGVSAFDTARAYGDAESVLGEVFAATCGPPAHVITKLDLAGITALASQSEVRSRVDASIDNSCQALGTEKLHTLLLHHAAHHDMWNGAAWQRMREHQKHGRVSVLGVSVYEPQAAIAALADPAIRHLQIPLNILDWRWKVVAKILGEHPEVIVHARSSLLQGILVHAAERWPAVAGCDRAACVRTLRALAQKFHRENVADLCFAYVRSLPWVTGVVVGCETLDQVERNSQLFTRPTLHSDEVEELERSSPRCPEALLNPAKWPMAEQIAAYAS
jgi:spore coat polysaccharide biosynthesis protein SpsF (cytidylyltransferase family)/aryl-alcohol dehydrogenase-like predicted oxidoreductase